MKLGKGRVECVSEEVPLGWTSKKIEKVVVKVIINLFVVGKSVMGNTSPYIIGTYKGAFR
jgi:hypothetical protein